MKRTRKIWLGILVLMFVFSAVHQASSDDKQQNKKFSTPRYQITDLGTLPSFTHYAATDINEQGQVAAAGYSAAGSGCKALAWDSNKYTEIAETTQLTCFDGRINNKGAIVGTLKTERGTEQAYQWYAGKLSLLETPMDGSSCAYCLNSEGSIVGRAVTKAGKSTACLWENGKCRELAIPLQGTDFCGRAINDQHQIVGTYSANGHRRVFLYDDATKKAESLPDLGSNFAEAYAISDDGIIVGASKKSSEQRAPMVACVWIKLWYQCQGANRRLGRVERQVSRLSADT